MTLFNKKEVGIFDHLPAIPEGQQFAKCPQCDSLLGLSPDRFPSTKCGCGFYGIPTKFVSREEALGIIKSNKEDK